MNSHAASSAASASNPPASLFPQLTFTQGFLVGQISVVFIVVALIRYLLLEDTPSGATATGEDGKAKRRSGRSASFPVSSTSSQDKPSNSLLSLSLSLGGSSGKGQDGIPARVKSPPPPSTNATGESFGAGPSLPALARIPEAVGYDMETAADTDVGWLNVLLAHAWAGYRDDFLAGGTNRTAPAGSHAYQDVNSSDEDSMGSSEGDDDLTPLSSSEDEAPPTTTPANRTAALLMHEVLNRPKVEEGKLDFLDEIEVTECLLGNSYPTLSNARVRPRDDQGRVRVEIDVDYTDLLSLALRTCILVNYPRPRFAVLPISLGVRITRFSGTLSLSLTSFTPASTSADKRSRHTMQISLHPDFLLSATCSSLVGSRAKLQDIPKIQQLILQRIRTAIMDRVGWPKTFDVELPDLVRRGVSRADVERQRRRESRRRAHQRAYRQSNGRGRGTASGYPGPPLLQRRGYSASSRMQGIVEEGDAADGPLDSAEEEDMLMAAAENDRAESTLDPQEALRRMRVRRRILREQQQRQQQQQRGNYFEEDDPQRTPRSKRTAALAGAGAGAGGYGYGGYGGAGQTTALNNKPPSQFTSISRRPINPRHVASERIISSSNNNKRESARNGGGGGGERRRREKNGSGTRRSKRRDEHLLDGDDDDEGDGADLYLDGGRRPPGSLPTVEAWRKEMVRKTHGTATPTR